VSLISENLAVARESNAGRVGRTGSIRNDHFLGWQCSACEEGLVNDLANCSRSLSIFGLAAALAIPGCYDPDAGMVSADRTKRAQSIRANSDRPPEPSRSRTKRPDFNDVSPASRAGKGQP